MFTEFPQLLSVTTLSNVSSCFPVYTYIKYRYRDIEWTMVESPFIFVTISALIKCLIERKMNTAAGLLSNSSKDKPCVNEPPHTNHPLSHACKYKCGLQGAAPNGVSSMHILELLAEGLTEVFIRGSGSVPLFYHFSPPTLERWQILWNLTAWIICFEEGSSHAQQHVSWVDLKQGSLIRLTEVLIQGLRI